MLFNSYEFILLYLPITLVLYYQLAKRFSNGAAKNFLIFASLCFYSYWDINNLPILLASIIANYIFGHLLSKNRSKYILTAGIAFNLLFLAYFKYTDFILQNLNALAGTSFELQSIVLPLGVSFFTFTQTAYLVDVYRGETKEYTKSDYLLFVTIFPHLIAGPILYHKDMIPQFSVAENYKLNYKNLTYGIVWFTIGLLKKVVIADKLAVWANQVFNNTSNLTMLDAWGGSLAYSLQLYFDFSGYSEMAIGLGLLFNYNLPLNFNLPYRATSIIDFWRRWHMTLSAFLKNYLYIPLGGNRSGNHMRNILITMFLGGLWHGAGWTFIFWGVLHGVFICINHLWRKTKIVLPKFLCWLLTFNAVNLAWIFFRANSFESAMNIVKAMVDFEKLVVPHSNGLGKYFEAFKNGSEIMFSTREIGIIILCLIIAMHAVNKKYIERINPYFTAIGLAVAFIYAFSKIGQISEFLYFQF
ncbi:MAG: MBOAT family protein [Phascolarctobacterium sp.]|nr:MBOAT family protein [Phascolarctobacterium sp.]